MFACSQRGETRQARERVEKLLNLIDLTQVHSDAFREQIISLKTPRAFHLLNQLALLEESHERFLEKSSLKALSFSNFMVHYSEGLLETFYVGFFFSKDKNIRIPSGAFRKNCKTVGVKKIYGRSERYSRDFIIYSAFSIYGNCSKIKSRHGSARKILEVLF